MGSKDGTTRLAAALRAAGWAMVRFTQHGHALYRCPCGEHFATVGGSKANDHGRGPIEARIKRCQVTNT